jgi:hypothetical protein
MGREDRHSLPNIKEISMGKMKELWQSKTEELEERYLSGRMSEHDFKIEMKKLGHGSDRIQDVIDARS